MALINRMSRLLSADIHAVLDRIEEPEALLRQSIREMEEALASAEQHAKRLEHEREVVADRRRKLEASLGDVDAQLDVCFGAGNDTLARKLVRRKLETERSGKHLAERLETIDKALAAQRVRLVEQHEQLDVLRQKAELFTEGSEPRGMRFAKDPGTSPFAVGDDEVEVAFLRERQRRQPS
jgi:phage shock protein A